MTFFEYCAICYLDQWITKDKVFYEALSGENEQQKLEALEKAAAFYGIARNIPAKGKNINKRFGDILGVLERCQQSDFKSQKDLISTVDSVRKDISDICGGSDNGFFPAASKLLWLKFRDPVVIYDSRTRSALGTDERDYAAFVGQWKRVYKKYSKQIGEACSKLDENSNYTIDSKLTGSEDFREVLCKSWFRKRVFDIYLWHVGKFAQVKM